MATLASNLPKFYGIGKKDDKEKKKKMKNTYTEQAVDLVESGLSYEEAINTIIEGKKKEQDDDMDDDDDEMEMDIEKMSPEMKEKYMKKMKEKKCKNQRTSTLLFWWGDGRRICQTPHLPLGTTMIDVDSLIDQYLESKNSGYTKGMLNKLKELPEKMRCSSCDMKIPVYTGRYPKKCPSCGEDLTQGETILCQLQ